MWQNTPCSTYFQIVPDRLQIMKYFLPISGKYYGVNLSPILEQSWNKRTQNCQECKHMPGARVRFDLTF